jgi:enoyl-CoA hydratase
MSYSQILFDEAEDGIVTLTVNRPEKLNALNAATMAELENAFERAASTASVRGLIVTGEGEKAFVAGADIREFEKMTAMEAQAFSLSGQRVFRRLETMGKPSIAALNGFALGGGLELAMSCTLRVASAKAKLGLPEVKLGLIPGYGGTQRLPRLVGRGRAMELLLAGEPVTAEEAFRIGLVNRVAAPEALMETTREMLAKILANGPQAIALAMQAVDTGLSSGFEEGLRAEASAFGLAMGTEDRAEGCRAFLERRLPDFSGK